MGSATRQRQRSSTDRAPCPNRAMALHLAINPYEPAHSHPVRCNETRSSDSQLRLALYSHVTAIIGCAVVSLLDTGRLRLDGFWGDFLIRFLIPLAYSWIVWPVITITIAWRGSWSIEYKLLIAILSILLTLFQLWACLPLVQ